ncbi:Tubulin epsilon chain [Hypsibius exemplaris]|uniref:Tubulin epsilon chain n=1 Tax=Hypsibius exemplaris TaxID=2072580 RepID=A0A1W0WI04_HYPEX|nr:Tubulin epsilon chain [Hypsibius exemplaris]
MSHNVVISIGQCGNQIGSEFWDRVVHSHALLDTDGTFTSALATFFRNTDGRHDSSLPIGSRLKHLQANAVLIDMETRVVDRLLRGPLGDLFDKRMTLTDSCGSGNNWSTGHLTYGLQHEDTISEMLRRSAEPLDQLQSFSVLHSMGGGTGSGLGTAVVKMMARDYGKTARLVSCVFPGDQDDVVTSPYNSVLALKVLAEDADSVISLDNNALSTVCSKHVLAGRPLRKSPPVPFDQMNDLVARMLADLTSSIRFGGELSIPLSELPVRMSPFPRMKFLIPGLSPVTGALPSMESKKIDRTFYEAFERRNQLMDCDPQRSAYLACLLLARGKDIAPSDVQRNVDKMKRYIHFAPGSKDEWAVSLCGIPSQSHPRSFLTLANNGCFHKPMQCLKERFVAMYRGRAHLHHYLLNGMEAADFEASLESLSALISDYRQVDAAGAVAANVRDRGYVAVGVVKPKVKAG